MTSPRKSKSPLEFVESLTDSHPPSPLSTGVGISPGPAGRAGPPSHVEVLIREGFGRWDRITPFRLARIPLWLGGALKADGFVSKNLRSVPNWGNRYELLRASFERAPAQGLVLEFGVFHGDSINRLAGYASHRTDPRVFGFDSFEGLPEDWFIGIPRESFRTGPLPDVRPNVTLVKGLFQDSVVPFLKDHPEPAAFVHIDSDLYSSAQYVLETLHSHGRLTGHPVIVFDDFFGGPSWWTGGEYLAFHQFTERHHVPFEYIGQTLGDQLAVVL
jgi:hypothetical protein